MVQMRQRIPTPNRQKIVKKYLNSKNDAKMAKNCQKITVSEKRSKRRKPLKN